MSERNLRMRQAKGARIVNVKDFDSLRLLLCDSSRVVHLLDNWFGVNKVVKWRD